MTARHLRFLVRWFFLYNARLVWWCWRLPRRLPAEAALPEDADARRRRAHRLLEEASAGGAGACAACGRCCQEAVDRFTPFDHMVRIGTSSPAPTWDRRLLSLPWMMWNAVRHGAQRLATGSRRALVSSCVHLTPSGCRLPRAERPMICVSWFCPTFVRAMTFEAMEAAEMPLREIEALHREAVRSVRAARRIR